MALNIRALYGALIRALVVLIPAFSFTFLFALVGCASNPGSGVSDTNQPDPTCTKVVNGQCVEVDSGSDSTPQDETSTDTATNPPDSGTPDTGIDQDTNVQVDSGEDNGTVSDSSNDSLPPPPDTNPLDSGNATDTGADTTVVDTSNDTGTADTTPTDTGIVSTDTGADTTVVDTGSSDTGTTQDSGSDAADSTSTDTGTADTGSADTGPTYTSLSCGTPVQDTAFAAFKINGTTDVELVGGIWGTSANDFYIPVSGYGASASPAAVAHWMGSSFVQEALPNAAQVFSIWGDNGGNAWVAGRGGRGRLYEHVAGSSTWVEDTAVPLASNFVGMAGSYLVGNTYGDLQAWQHVGGSWIPMTVPTYANGPTIHRLYWVDDAHAYIVGCRHDTGTTACTNPLILAVSGTSWVDITPSMAEANELFDVSGNLTDGLYFVGWGPNATTTSGLQAVAYQMSYGTSGLGIVNTVTTPSMSGNMAAHSFGKGLFVTGGQDQTSATGSGRVTRVDAVDAPSTFSAGSQSYGVNQFWQVPGTTTVHYVNNAAPTNVAQHYVMTCTLN